jgi:hypothetical protein
MRQNYRLTGRRGVTAFVLAAVTATGGVALAPAASADSTVASATTAYSAPHSAAAHPDTINECYQVLQAYRYTVSVARGIACLVAASAPVNEAAKIASCIGLMKVAGVELKVAALACTIATAPG